MRSVFYGTVVFAMILVTAIFGCSKKEPTPMGAQAEMAKPVEKVSAPSEAPGNKVKVDEDILVVLSGQAGDHFHTARENFMGDYLAIAADEIRIGAAIIKLEAARATPEGKTALMASIEELSQLASAVEMNSVADALELDAVFARANYALANHRHLKAQEFQAQGEHEKAALELRAAAGNVERGFGWAGGKMEEGAIATINGARLVTGKVIQAPGWVISKTGRALAAVGRATGKGIGAVGRGVGSGVGAVGGTVKGVGKGTGDVVKGVTAGTGKAVEEVGKGTKEAVDVVGKETSTGVVAEPTGKVVGGVTKATGEVVKGVGSGAGTVVEGVGEGAGTVIEGVGKGTGEAVEAVGKGVGWVPEQLGNSIDSIGKLIQKLGKAVEPQKK